MKSIAIILDRYEIFDDGTIIDLHKEELEIDYLDIEEEVNDDIPEFIYKIADILLENI